MLPAWAVSLAMLMTVLVVHPGQSATVRMSEAVNLVSLPVTDESDIAADLFGNWHVIWIARPEDDDQRRLLVYSGGDGQRWSAPADVIALGGTAAFPRLTVSDDGWLYACWQGDLSATYFSSAPITGAGSSAGWSQPVAVSESGAFHCDLTTDSSGTIHLVYASRGEEVYYLSSVDRGMSWALRERVSAVGPDNATDYPGIDLDELGRIHVVWTEYTLEEGNRIQRTSYARSTDGGVSWSIPHTVTTDRIYGEVAVLTSGEHEVHLAWNGSVDHGGRYYKRSTDGGQTWSSVITVVPADALGTGLTGPPDMEVDSEGTVYLVASLNPGGVTVVEIMNGVASEGEFVSSPSGWAEKGRIAISGGNRIGVLWQSYFSLGSSEAPAVGTREMPRPSVTVGPTAIAQLGQAPPEAGTPSVRLDSDLAASPSSGASSFSMITVAALASALTILIAVAVQRRRRSP